MFVVKVRESVAVRLDVSVTTIFKTREALVQAAVLKLNTAHEEVSSLESLLQQPVRASNV